VGRGQSAPAQTCDDACATPDLACAPDACCASVEVFCGQIRRSLGKEAWNEACDAYFYSSGGIAPKW
jgi:hypothetical protein